MSLNPYNRKQIILQVPPKHEYSEPPEHEYSENREQLRQALEEWKRLKRRKGNVIGAIGLILTLIGAIALLPAFLDFCERLSSFLDAPLGFKTHPSLDVLLQIIGGAGVLALWLGGWLIKKYAP